MPTVVGANRTRVDLDPSVAVTTPAGTQAGDLLLAINGCDTDGVLANLGLPSGFTELDNHDAGDQPIQRVGYLVLAGSPNASYTFATDDATEGDCTLVTIRDFDAADPFPNGLVIEGANAPGSADQEASSVIGIDGGLLIAGFARDRENNLANYTGAPTGMTLVIATPEDNWYIQALYEQDLTADGATGTRTATTTASTLWRGETDWLLVVAPTGGIIETVAQATETDLAQPIGSAKAKILGQATEIDLAQNITAEAAIVVELGQAVETDIAQAIIAEGGAELGTSYDIRIDWDNDGDFDDTGENVTPRARTDISIQYGRDQARALSPAQPGQATVELQNTSKDYTPGNAASPLFGNLEPGRRLRMQATVNGNTYDLYRGNLDEYNLRPGFDDRFVAFTALDALGRFREDEISTELHHGIRTGTAIDLILDAVGWPAADRDIDLGATIIPWWWEDRTDAFTALQKVVTSEGPTALATVSSDGGFIFRDRHHRLTRTASLVSQATFRGSGAEPLIVEPFGYDLGWRDIINSVTFSVGERAPSGVAEQVWSGDGIYSVADGETLIIRTQPSDPVLNAITPVEGTDFRLRSGAVSVALSQTSGTAIAILITGVGGPAVLDELQLRAFPVAVRRTVQIEAEDTVSIERYGTRAPNIDAPWVNVHDALAIAEVALAHRAERTPTIQARMVSGLNNSDRLEQQLTRDLSDRVTVVADSPSVDDDFYIEQIRHLITQAGTSHETVFGCEQAPAQIDDAFTFDVAGRGFDDGRFGMAGLSDPDNMFRFDEAGRGFNDGLLAY